MNRRNGNDENQQDTCPSKHTHRAPVSAERRRSVVGMDEVGIIIGEPYDALADVPAQIAMLKPEDFAEKLNALTQALLDNLKFPEASDSLRGTSVGLDEIHIHVTLTASGNLAVIKGSVEAGIEIVFRRPTA
jgi:hypothetical protein